MSRAAAVTLTLVLASLLPVGSGAQPPSTCGKCDTTFVMRPLAFGRDVLEKQMTEPSYLPADVPRDSNPERVMGCSECRLAALGTWLDTSFFESYLKGEDSALGTGCTLRSVLAGLRLSAAAVSGRDLHRFFHPGGQSAPDPKRVEAAYRLVAKIHEKCSNL
jgi:hypothetical protein